jgi:protein-S-isoprenylcysteine O-methyltransferase Ste14
MALDWNDYRRGKLYDLAAGLPLILWFGYNTARLRPNLVANARAVLEQPDSLLANVRFFALFAAVAFNLLLIYLVVVRTEPVRRSAGVMPRLCGFAGTFLGVGILYLKPVPLPLFWQIAAAFLVLAGSLGSVIVLGRLGKSFSIMPEARALVTGGPYAYARHPLYAAEIITVLGMSLQYQQPWGAAMGGAVILLQVTRSLYEERVLVQAFPEYEAYRARTKRFIPGVI